jgi:hypothetical protein
MGGGGAGAARRHERGAVSGAGGGQGGRAGGGVEAVQALHVAAGRMAQGWGSEHGTTAGAGAVRGQMRRARVWVANVGCGRAGLRPRGAEAPGLDTGVQPRCVGRCKEVYHFISCKLTAMERLIV